MADTAVVEDVPPAAGAGDAAAAADVEAQTDAPKVPLQRVPRPSDAKKKEAVAELKAKVNAALTEVRSVRDTIREARDGSSGGDQAIREVRDRMKAIQAEAQGIRNERTELFNARKAIQERQSKRREESRKARASIKYTSLRSVNERIAELENQQQTTRLTLNEEKAIVRELSELRAAQKTMQSFESKRDSGATSGDGEKDEWKVLNERITAKGAELKAVNERLTAQRKIHDELMSKKQERRSGIPELVKRRDELNEQVRELRAQINKVNEDYWTQLQAWRAWKRQNDQERYQQRQAEVAEEQKRREAELKKLEEEEAKRHPWERQMGLCDALISQMSALGGSSADESKGQAASGAGDAGIHNGLRVMRKEVEDDWGAVSGGKKKKGKKGKRGKKSKAEALRLDLDTHNCFQQIKVAAPRTTADLTATIESLKARRAEYDVMPRPAKKGQKAAAAATTTDSGAGAGNGDAAPAADGDDAPVVNGDDA